MNAMMNRTPTEADLRHIAEKVALRSVLRGVARPNLLGRGHSPPWDDPPAHPAEYVVAAARELMRLGLTDTTGLPRTPVVEALEHAWALLRLTEETDR